MFLPGLVFGARQPPVVFFVTSVFLIAAPREFAPWSCSRNLARTAVDASVSIPIVIPFVAQGKMRYAI